MSAARISRSPRGARAAGGTRRRPRRRGAPRRDAARSRAHSCELSRAPALPDAGDLLVVNTSATLAGRARRATSPASRCSFGSPRRSRDGAWIVELRTCDGRAHPQPPVGATLDLPNGAHAELLARLAGSDRLVVARFDLGEPLEDYLADHGQPIRYGYVPEPWPVDAYQTVFAPRARQRGDGECGPAFHRRARDSNSLARGVLVAPVVLHTGVSSPERGEPPYPERFRVPDARRRSSTQSTAGAAA